MPRVRPARVLIVDESPSMRLVISRALLSDQNLQVVGEAGDPLEASQLIAAVAPDVVTLDIRMPHMGGLEFLSWIMRNRPLPVVMVSRLTTAGAEMTIKALELGAVDWVAKPTPEDPHTFRDLSAKVQRAAQCQLPRQHGRQHASQHRRLASSTRETYQPNGRVVAIGSSTGGVEALISLLSEFPENCPATLIAQDMPAPYTRSFAERLDRLCRPHVSEAIDGEPVLPGRVYLAPGGGAHLEVDRDNGLLCRLRQEAPVNGQRPSVDVLFTSVAKFVG